MPANAQCRDGTDAIAAGSTGVAARNELHRSASAGSSGRNRYTMMSPERDDTDNAGVPGMPKNGRGGSANSDLTRHARTGETIDDGPRRLLSYDKLAGSPIDRPAVGLAGSVEPPATTEVTATASLATTGLRDAARNMIWAVTTAAEWMVETTSEPGNESTDVINPEPPERCASEGMMEVHPNTAVGVIITEARDGTVHGVRPPLGHAAGDFDNGGDNPAYDDYDPDAPIAGVTQADNETGGGYEIGYEIGHEEIAHHSGEIIHYSGTEMTEEMIEGSHKPQNSEGWNEQDGSNIETAVSIDDHIGDHRDNNVVNAGNQDSNMINAGSEDDRCAESGPIFDEVKARNDDENTRNGKAPLMIDESRGRNHVNAATKNNECENKAIAESQTKNPNKNGSETKDMDRVHSEITDGQSKGDRGVFTLTAALQHAKANIVATNKEALLMGAVHDGYDKSLPQTVLRTNTSASSKIGGCAKWSGTFENRINAKRVWVEYSHTEKMVTDTFTRTLQGSTFRDSHKAVLTIQDLSWHASRASPQECVGERNMSRQDGNTNGGQTDLKRADRYRE